MSAATGPGRLVAAGTVTFAGAATCIACVRATWASAAQSAFVVPIGGGGGAARIPVAGRTLSGVDLGAGLALVSALAVCVLVAVGVLAQPRTRRNLLSMATAFAGIAAGVTITAALGAARRAASAGLASPSVRTGVVAVAVAGACLAVAGCIVAIWYARVAPPVRMPEGAPEAQR